MERDWRFDATLERFTGFGSHYNEVRPIAPEALAPLLCDVAKCTRPQLVVDLGSGTGLSSRYWGAHAEAVIGVEPTDDMRAQAESAGGDNITYRKAYAHATGLPDGCADLVVCSQSLHWMDPPSTFAEARRLLRPGGVFAACDYDWPPVTEVWEVDAAYLAYQAQASQLEKERGITEQVQRWGKDGHLARMRTSGCFRFCRECLLHHVDRGGAERIVGLALSQGGTQSLLKLGVSEAALLLDKLREVADGAFGTDTRPWLWSARVRLGVK